jgi:hypothetical protein
MPALIAPKARAERWNRHVVWISAHVENVKVIAAATETPDRKRSHAVLAHIAEGHGRAG